MIEWQDQEVIYRFSLNKTNNTKINKTKYPYEYRKYDVNWLCYPIDGMNNEFG